MSEWHLNPVEVLNTWSLPLIELMIKTYGKRKMREADAMQRAQDEAKSKAGGMKR